jgi:hypothetical protein
VEVFRRQRVHALDRRLLVRGKHQRSKAFEALAGQVGTGELCELLLNGFVYFADERFVPRHENRHARRVLGLSDQIESDPVRLGAVIGGDDDLTRPGETVDRHLTEHLLLRKLHVGVTRSDDHVHRLETVHAIGHRCDRLRPTQPVHFGDAQFVAGGEHIGVVRAGCCGREAHDDLLDAGRLRRADGHQERGWVCGRPTRAIDADTVERAVTQLQFVPFRDAHHRIAVQQPRLELQHVVLHLPDRIEELGAGGRVCLGEFRWLDPHHVGLELHLVELLGVTEDRWQPLVADVVADAFDGAGRGEVFAEDGEGELFTGRRDHLGVVSELVAEFCDLGRGTGRREVDPPQLQACHSGNLAGAGSVREDRGPAVRREKDQALEPDPHGTGTVPSLIFVIQTTAPSRKEPPAMVTVQIV